MKPILRIVFVCAIGFGFGLTTASAADTSVLGIPDGFKDWHVPGGFEHFHYFSFKLRAGGHIDESTSTITFAGHATFFEQFTATGQFDPSIGLYVGTITTKTGDTVNWHGYFLTSPSGETWIMGFDHGTGDFLQFNGGVGGPPELDEDGMFSFRLEGRVAFLELGF